MHAFTQPCPLCLGAHHFRLSTPHILWCFISPILNPEQTQDFSTDLTEVVLVSGTNEQNQNQPNNAAPLPPTNNQTKPNHKGETESGWAPALTRDVASNQCVSRARKKGKTGWAAKQFGLTLSNNYTVRNLNIVTWISLGVCQQWKQPAASNWNKDKIILLNAIENYCMNSDLFRPIQRLVQDKHRCSQVLIQSRDHRKQDWINLQTIWFSVRTYINMFWENMFLDTFIIC